MRRDVRGQIGANELGVVLGEHARHIDCHVAVANNHNGAYVTQEGRRGVRMRVVPAGKFSGSYDTGQILTGNAEPPVARCADRKHNRVVQVAYLVQADIAAYFDISKKIDALP